METSGDYVLQHRRDAAERSRGISSDPIYDCIRGVLAERDLHGTVLDYGAGVGHLTSRLLGLSRFSRVSAADILPAPPELVARVEWIEQDLNAPISGHDAEFDVVIAAEVIEHLENPRAMLRDLFRLLRPGGTAIVSTPNNESWRSLLALLVRGHYVAFGDTSYPAHITALLHKDFVRIVQECRFNSPEFRYTDNGGIPLMPSVTWQSASFGLLRGRRFSDNVVVAATRPG